MPRSRDTKMGDQVLRTTGSRRSVLWRRHAGLLYFLPLLTLIAVFIAYPLFETFRLSFLKVALNGSEKFVGFDNYKAVIESPVVMQVLRNTIVWVIMNVSGLILGGLLVALMMNRSFRGKGLFMVFMLLPWATPVIAAVLSWVLIYDPLYGHLNAFLGSVGLMDPANAYSWLGNPRLALLGVSIARVWTGIPFCAFSILAAMLAIPPDLIRAARIDGGGSWQIFWKVTLQLIRPTLILLIVLTSIWSFNGFDLIFVMTGGGPAYSSEILVTNVYRNVFQYPRPGLASALSVIDFFILATATILFVWLSSKQRTGGLRA